VTSHQTRWSGKTRVLRVPTASEPSTRCGNQRIKGFVRPRMVALGGSE